MVTILSDLKGHEYYEITKEFICDRDNKEYELIGIIKCSEDCKYSDVTNDEMLELFGFVNREYVNNFGRDLVTTFIDNQIFIFDCKDILNNMDDYDKYLLTNLLVGNAFEEINKVTSIYRYEFDDDIDESRMAWYISYTIEQLKLIHPSIDIFPMLYIDNSLVIYSKRVDDNICDTTQYRNVNKLMNLAIEKFLKENEMKNEEKVFNERLDKFNEMIESGNYDKNTLKEFKKENMEYIEAKFKLLASVEMNDYENETLIEDAIDEVCDEYSYDFPIICMYHEDTRILNILLDEESELFKNEDFDEDEFDEDEFLELVRDRYETLEEEGNE